LARATLYARSVHGLRDDGRAMASAKSFLGGAGVTAVFGIRVARSLHARWRTMGPDERQRLAPLAADAKERALELRGVADRDSAERELATANETLAAAIVDSAQANPEVSESDLAELRDDLRRELDRLATAEISASRRAGQ
jgi:hypothetical protein